MKQQQDQDITQLIEKHQKLIYKVVNSYCSDIHEQEDLIQEIIFQLIKSYGKFDHKVKVTTWMYKVAFNIAISHFRKIKNRQKYLVPMPEKLVNISAHESQENENLIRLRKFMNELKPLDKAILIMYLDENSHADIAQAMGVSTSNVGTKINRIKQQLKKKFNQ
jgi:RNA polymerase sigma-70 factor (ECF subfamily)